MSHDKWSSLMSRLFFFAAFALLALSIAEKIANLAEYTILRAIPASRLLEYAVILLFFVMALLLRQIREELRRFGPRGT